MSSKAERIKNVGKVAENTLKMTGNTIANVGANAVDKVKNLTENLDFEETLNKAMKVPGVRVNRKSFLAKEFKGKYSQDVIDLAIQKNPAYAGISRDDINKLAKAAIRYESSKVTLFSAAAGVPGGAAMAATVPADLIQYFGFLFRIMQKLAYLYGFEEFEHSESTFSEDAMNEILVFTGVMFGVKNANVAVKIIANAAAKKIARSLPRKALTKGVIYPIIKKIAIALGFNFNKQVFADAASKAVYGIGGLVSGGLTFATFRPAANRLRRKLAELNISDPNFYRLSEEEQDNLLEQDDVIEIKESDLEID